MARYFLNEIDQKHGSVQPPTAGRWTSDADSTDFLTRFAASIKVTGQLTNAHLVHSVPSMFARPILFYQALANPEHPLHGEVVSQWRGLLGLFALQKVEGLVLSVRRYNVPTLDEASGRSDLQLCTALRNQLPHPVVDWDHWWLLYCNDVLVGATSPWSMFFTPSQYACPSVIPWRDTGTGLLVDPLMHYGKLAVGKPLPEVTVLLRWIELVLDGAPWGLAESYPVHSGKVKKELELWRDELRPQRHPLVSISKLNDDARIDMGAWKFFSQAPDHETSGNQSTLVLDTRPGVVPTLVLSRTALKDSDRVWGKTFANQIDFSTLPGPRGSSFTARNGAEIKSPYVIAEEAFFPLRLMRLPLSSKAYTCGANDYAIPLTPAFFSYLSHDFLVKHRDALTTAVSGEKVTVTLRLPLSGSKNRLKVEKSYNVQNDVFDCPDPIPAFAVWPDFRAKDWNEYFAACAGDGTMSTAQPMLESGALLDPLPLGQGDNPLRIWPCDTPPLGFALFHRFSLSQETAESLYCVGMVLAGDFGHLGSPAENVSWRVAVDFGTSSTNVLVDKGGGPPTLMSIAGRTVMLTAGDEALKATIGVGLYPTNPVPAPFVTLLARNTSSFYRGGPPYTARFFFQPRGDDEYLTDVKWSTGGGAKDLPLREYLRNIVRLIVCEARHKGVGKLSFEWSYPLSLPAGPRGAMEDYWSGVTAAYSQTGGMSVSASRGMTESDAVCRCFATEVTAPVSPGGSGLSIVVDIGGGSSDIGFWSSRTLLDQVSIKLAGNDLLPRLWNLKDFVPKLYSVCFNAAWDFAHHTRFSSGSAIFVNSILSEVGAAGGDPKRHPFVLHLLNNEAYGEKPWVNVRSLLFLFFAGLSLYLGLHARKHRSTANSEVEVYFCGRGASLIPWIGTPDKIKRRLEYFFKFGFERDVPENKNATIVFGGPSLSPGEIVVPPKEEVVRGLLATIVDWKAQTMSTSTTIPCETAWELDGKTVRWDEPLTAEALRRLMPPTNHESSFISTLMNLIADKGLDELNLDPALKGLWSRKGAFSQRVQRYLVSSLSVADPVLQPVFTCELAALMDQYVQETLSGLPTEI